MANNNVETKFNEFSVQFGRLKQAHTARNKGLSLDKYNLAISKIEAAITSLNAQWPESDFAAFKHLRNEVIASQRTASEQQRPRRFLEFLFGRPEYFNIESYFQQLLSYLNSAQIDAQQGVIVELTQQIGELRNSGQQFTTDIATLNGTLKSTEQSLKVTFSTILAGIIIFTYKARETRYEPTIDAAYERGLHTALLAAMNLTTPLTAQFVASQIDTVTYNHKKPESGNGVHNGVVHLSTQPISVAATPAPITSTGNPVTVEKSVVKLTSNDGASTVKKRKIPNPNFSEEPLDWIRTKPGISSAHYELIKQLCEYGNNSATSAEDKQGAVKLIAYLLLFETSNTFDTFLRTEIVNKQLAEFQARANKLNLSSYRTEMRNYSVSSNDEFKRFAKYIYFGFHDGKHSIPKESEDNKQSEHFVPYTKSSGIGAKA